MQILKVTEFQGGSGRWYVADNSQPYWNWRYIPNMLGLNVQSYVELLKKYKAGNLHYYAPTDCFLYSFSNSEDAHKWVLYINRIARNKKYYWGKEK